MPQEAIYFTIILDIINSKPRNLINIKPRNLINIKGIGKCEAIRNDMKIGKKLIGKMLAVHQFY